MKKERKRSALYDENFKKIQSTNGIKSGGDNNNNNNYNGLKIKVRWYWGTHWELDRNTLGIAKKIKIKSPPKAKKKDLFQSHKTKPKNGVINCKG